MVRKGFLTQVELFSSDQRDESTNIQIWLVQRRKLHAFAAKKPLISVDHSSLQPSKATRDDQPRSPVLGTWACPRDNHKLSSYRVSRRVMRKIIPGRKLQILPSPTLLSGHSFECSSSLQSDVRYCLRISPCTSKE